MFGKIETKGPIKHRRKTTSKMCLLFFLKRSPDEENQPAVANIFHKIETDEINKWSD